MDPCRHHYGRVSQPMVTFRRGLRRMARRRYPSERRRVTLTAALGLLIGGGLAFAVPWQLAAIAGWDVAASVLTAWVLASTIRLNAEDTRRFAVREDDSRSASWFVVVVSCVAILVAVFLGIIKARSLSGVLSVALLSASVIAVVVAWITVHTTFMLHYAHRYFSDDDDDGDGANTGIDFPSENCPSYVEFAYVAFTVGMTFQVSDTDITTTAMRSLVLRHTALSYLFGTVLVGLTINILAGILGSG